jgi:hypothetical protein
MIKLISDDFWDVESNIENNNSFQYFIPNWIILLLDWVWLNRDQILQQVSDNMSLTEDRYGFEVFYPEYGGIPQHINKNLQPCHLKVINKHLVFMLSDYANEKDFKKKFLSALTNNTIQLT